MSIKFWKRFAYIIFVLISILVATLLWYIALHYLQPVFWDPISSTKTVALYLAPWTASLVALVLFSRTINFRVQAGRKALYIVIILFVLNLTIVYMLTPYAKAQIPCMKAADIVREAEVATGNRCMMLYNGDVHSHRSGPTRPYDAWPKEHQGNPCQVRETPSSGTIYDATRLISTVDYNFHPLSNFVGANTASYLAPMCASVRVTPADIANPDVVRITDVTPTPPPTPPPTFTYADLKLAVVNYVSSLDNPYPPTQNSKVNLFDIGFITKWVL